MVVRFAWKPFREWLRLPGLVLNGGPSDACKYQPGPPPLHILHRTPRIIGAGIPRIKMYAGATGTAVHAVFRRGLVIAAVHPEFNLRKPAYQEGENRRPLQFAASA